MFIILLKKYVIIQIVQIFLFIGIDLSNYKLIVKVPKLDISKHNLLLFSLVATYSLTSIIFPPQVL